MLAISSRMLPFNSCMVRSFFFFPCTLAASGSRQEKKIEDVNSGNGRCHTFFEIVLSCSGAMTRAMKTSATLNHLLRARKILTHSVGMNRQCSWSKVHLFPIIRSRITGKDVPGVVCEFKHKKIRRQIQENWQDKRAHRCSTVWQFQQWFRSLLRLEFQCNTDWKFKQKFGSL